MNENTHPLSEYKNDADAVNIDSKGAVTRNRLKGQDGLNNREAQTTETTNDRKYKEGDSKIDISKKKENNKTDSRKDKGWAWVIVAGTFLHVFMYVGLGKSFGLFFVEFLRVYDTSSSLLSGMLSAQNLMFSLSTVFVLNIATRFLGPRKLILIGSFICSGAYLLNAYVPGVAVLFISHGILYGIGVACITGPIFVVMNTYFEDKLGFATMIASSGGSAGSFVLPIIIQKLLDEYGLQGALLIVAGMLLNNLVVGVITRPFYTSAKSRDVNKTYRHETSKLRKNKTITNTTENTVMLQKHNDDFSVSVDNVASYYEPQQSENRQNGYTSYKKRSNKRTRSLSESCSTDYLEIQREKQTDKSKPIQDYLSRMSASTVDIYAGIGTADVLCSMYSLNALCHNNSTSDSEHQSRTCSCRDIIDCDMLKNRHLQLILSVSLVCVVGCGLIVIYIPPFAKDHDIPNDKIAILVTIMGACDLLSRFSLAWISDSKRIRRSQILGLCLGITGLATMFNPLFNSFQIFVFYSVIYGLFGSVYFSMLPLLLRESVGAERYPAALSLSILIHGISFTAITPLLGLARDLTGSYIVSFYVMGVGILIGSVCIFCEPIFKRMEEKRIERSRIK